MAVLTVKETPESRNGTLGSVDDNSIQRQWLITTSTRSDNVVTITGDSTYIASDVPSYLESHPANIFYTCRSVQLDPVSPVHWTATATYSTRPIRSDERERATVPNPLNRAAKVTIDSQEFERYADKDFSDPPLSYENSAGEPYPPQVVEDARLILRVRKNIGSWDASWFLLRNTVNSESVTITDGASNFNIVAETGYLKRLMMSEVQEENGVTFYVLSCEIHINTTADKWNRVLRDQGFFFKDASDQLTRFKVYDSSDGETSSGELIDSPVEQLLNGDGKPLRKPDGSLYDASIDQTQYNTFIPQPQEDWSALPFFV